MKSGLRFFEVSIMGRKDIKFKYFLYGNTPVVFVNYSDGRFQVLVADAVLKTYRHDIMFRHLIFSDQSGLVQEISLLLFQARVSLLGLPSLSKFLEDEMSENLSNQPLIQPKMQQLEKAV